MQLSQLQSNAIVGAFFLFLFFVFLWLARAGKERKKRFEQKRKEHNEFKKEFYRERDRIDRAGHFSPELEENINETLVMGERLKRKIN